MPRYPATLVTFNSNLSKVCNGGTHTIYTDVACTLFDMTSLSYVYIYILYIYYIYKYILIYKLYIRILFASRLGKEVPAGYEQFNYPVCSDAAKVDAQTVADAAAYVAALLDLEPVSDYGKPNERVLYELPGSDRRRLIMMLRSGESHVGHAMLASTCELETGAEPDPPPPNETMHFCRPGTGLYNAGLVGDRMPQNGQQQQQLQQQRERRQQEGKEEGGSGSEDGKGGQPQPPWPGYHPVPVGRHCNWTTPVVTNVRECRIA